jgi:hypothetical protein
MDLLVADSGPQANELVNCRAEVALRRLKHQSIA